ncbi:hypothetical protein MOQ72_01420 [Saccharopolyspora sp. K220]|uniref:hypothetical protein n=1 Tax=Saccharopolyspora soli TaxID=2926618 RepID=UPI001F5A020D|nr:hypothetical protein [Saccharopolyspora soli]MCI2416070.1 hypothetical protein [Saccharopolyspora soli]
MAANEPHGVGGMVPIYDAMLEELIDPASIDWQVSAPPCFVAELTEREPESDAEQDEVDRIAEPSVEAANAASDS